VFHLGGAAVAGGLQLGQLVGVARREAGPCQDRDRRQGDAVDLAEIFRFAFDGRNGQRGEDQFVGSALEHQVPVGRRVQHLLCGNAAAAATQVVDDGGLAQGGAQRHVDAAGDVVRQPAGRVGIISVTGLAGKVCAKTAPASTALPSRVATVLRKWRLRVVMLSPF
jgi:hypothetical protein